MQQLYNPSAYPPKVAAALKAATPLAVEIANRWMLGWPEAVKQLLDSQDFLPALQRQESEEREALAQAAGMQHLARHEVMQELGLNPGPPMPQPTST